MGFIKISDLPQKSTLESTDKVVGYSTTGGTSLLLGQAFIDVKNAAESAKSQAQSAASSATSAVSGFSSTVQTAKNEITAQKNSSVSAVSSQEAASKQAVVDKQSEATSALNSAKTAAVNEVTALVAQNALVKTVAQTLSDAQKYQAMVNILPNTPEVHNCFYRGKEHTVEGLSAKVLANDFSDIFIGDYFTVSFSTTYGTVTNQKCLVAGINYYLNCGDTATPTPHLVMIPETSFGSAQMNSSDTTEGGYAGSAMFTTVLPTIATALKNAIGASHIISQKRLLSSEMNSSTASMAGAGWTGASVNFLWLSCDLLLPSEPQVYGTTVCSSSFVDVGIGKQMLPLFSLNPQKANTRSIWWLSAVGSSAYFAAVHPYGYPDGRRASESNAVRPLFCFH